MNCDGVRGLLSAYLDGELSPGELLRVEQHLRRCHWCADEVDSLRQTIALVASMDEVEVPVTFHAQLHDRLVALGPPTTAVRRLPAAPAWQKSARRWAVPAAAAAAALAIGLSTFPQASDLARGLEAPRGTMQPVAESSGSPVPAQGPIGNDKPIVADAGDTDGNPTPNPVTEANPPSGAGKQPTETQPDPAPIGTPITGPGETYTVTEAQPGQTTTVALEARNTTSSIVTVSAENRESLVAALAQFGARTESDSILITVDAAKLDSVIEAIKSAPGVKLSADPATTVTNLAEPIAKATDLRNKYTQELTVIDQQLPKLKDGSDRDDMLAQRAATQLKLDQVTMELERLTLQVGKAFITVTLK